MAEVPRHVGPADNALGVNQDRCRQRDVLAVMAAAVAEAVGVGCEELRIGKDGEAETGVAHQLGVGLHRIDDHANHLTIARTELG